MDHSTSEPAGSLADSFSYTRLKHGFLWGLAAAIFLIATDLRPEVFGITALGDLLLFGAVIALAAIAVMMRDLFRGISHGVTRPSFWTAAGFVSAVTIGAILNLVGLA